MEKSIKAASLLIATIRALSIVHQQNHWRTKGEGFYGQHLLFERIYDSALEDLDSAAERSIGLFGLATVDHNIQSVLLSKILERYKDSEDPIVQSLKVETELLKMLGDISKIFVEESKLSLGLQDLIGAIASSREEACYLLKQSQLKE